MTSSTASTYEDLLDQPVRNSTPPMGFYAGRRLRVLANLLTSSASERTLFLATQPLRDNVARTFQWEDPTPPTYRHVYSKLTAASPLHPICITLSNLYIYRNSYPSPGSGNAYLSEALQDLGDQIIFDIHDACAAFDDPNLYYPGVDPPLIEPVTDEHIVRVIAGLQRELDRELRNAQGSRNTSDALPAAPLNQLPPQTQRALVERRRLRFVQWGVTYPVWARNSLSLWGIPEDSDWVPERLPAGR